VQRQRLQKIIPNSALSRPIEPGTIIEISLQRPGEEPMMANIKVQQEDLDLLESLKGLSE
jgi:hypothetical protein